MFLRQLTTSLVFYTHNKSTITMSSSSTSSSASIKLDKPFGSWESPITSKSIIAGSVSIGNLNILNDSLYWTEGRPKEGGRTVLCCQYLHNDKECEGKALDVSPKDSNIRSLVHEYGGGSLVFGSNPNHIFFSDFKEQNLCKLVLNPKQKSDSVSSVVIAKGNNGALRYADGVIKDNNDDEIIYCVREDHSKPNCTPKDVVNELISIDTNTGEINVVATGDDFYAAPRLSPDGKKLAYISWNHPHMPWDATSLYLVNIDESDSKSDSETPSPIHTKDHELIAGGDGQTSIIQPLWHPTQGTLYYISDQSGYYNIYRSSTKEPIFSMEHDFGGAAPGWILGQQGFNFLADGRIVAQYQKDGKSVLIVADVSGSGPATNVREYGMKDGLPMKLGDVKANDKNELYFIGGSPSNPSCIYKWTLPEDDDVDNDKSADDDKKENNNSAQILVSSSTLSFPDSVISVPKQVTFPTTLGDAYGYYYPPKNDGFECKTETAPPLIVKAHGGPTACASTIFSPIIQYWTSRGFAILDVDYGGSTGYGRAYRRRLVKSWGIVDIDDVCAGAKYLVAQSLADGNRLCIDGGSAGGYTTLGALAFRDVFNAGTSLYGIGDLTALAGDTHKFESRYLDDLVGPYPEDEAIYKARSPIESVDTLSCPILLLQGAEDKVVPPNQAQTMYEAVLKKGIPTCIKIYEGEQHGFRKAENIEDALDSELAFYGQVFGIDVPNAIDIKIDNMADK